MKSSTRLDSALFQLTPTRTRFDLVISANGKTEKIASGLLNPFLSHLKTAQEQMAKGGYSIILEPESGSDATWFTKSTVERFVRFVSTPEVLERVYTLESEILQIEEAISIQGNNDVRLNPVEDNHGKPVDSVEGTRAMLDTNEEKAIVLYQPDATQPEANGSTPHEENSKVQLLKVLETRKIMLQKEQGMAFARGVAAGFDVDHLPPLISFAECFGASRLKDACRRYKELWKRKHETGQWLEIEAAEAISTKPEFFATNASDIMLSSVTNIQNEVAWENNGKATSGRSSIVREEKPPMVHQPPLSHQEYFPGQFPHQMFPPWPVHSSPGALPAYPPYPMQGMPYYQNYPGSSPFLPPPYPTVEDPRLSHDQRMNQKRHSMDSSNGNIESGKWEMGTLRTRSLDDEELEKESSRTKGNRSGKKQSGKVVIQNINYITSKGKESSDSESQSANDSPTDEDDGDFQGGIPEMKVSNSRKSSKRQGHHAQSIDKFNLSEKEEMAFKEGDEGNWQAFQNFLLRDPDEDRHDLDRGMFSMEKKGQLKRRQDTLGDDPLVSGGLERGEIQEGSTTDINKYSGNVTRMQKSSNDALLISGREDQLGQSRAITDQMVLQPTEIDGRSGGYRRNANDDFMIHRRDNQSGFTSSPLDPLAVNGFDRSTNSLDRRSSNNMDDDSYIVPLRSTSLDHLENNDRNAIDMGSEFPSAVQKAATMTNRIGTQVDYEPDELTLMPERGAEKDSIGYDPALDYEMPVHAKDGASLDKKHKEVVSDNKQGSKKADKDRKSKLVSDTSDRKIGGPIRKGKPSKLSPLDEARARAEKLRSFKADLQKMKKEKEEEGMKRLEALKIQRQKRIASRGGSIPSLSPFPSQKTRKQGLTKLSPSTHKGSKFSDSEPGSSSPLQRVPIKTASVGSADSHKTSKSSKLGTGSHSAGNRLSRSVSSLPEQKKDNAGVTSDTKSSMALIRRLSEPKVTNSHRVSSVKPRSSVTVSKPQVSDVPESKKISAIVNYDKSKAATLPELKIRTSKGPDVAQSTSTTKGTVRKDSSMKSTSEGAQVKRNDDKSSQHSDRDDNPVIEKTVVMLEKPSIPTVHASEENLGDEKRHNSWEKTELVSEYAAIRAPAYPPTIATVSREPTHDLLQQQIQSHEATTSNVEKEPAKVSSSSTVEKPYQAPYVQVSSLEDPCTQNSEYGKPPPTNLETVATGTVTMKALVSESSSLKLEKIPEALERPQVKESSKGFRRLLKFGRKNHGSSSGERDVESDDVSTNGSNADENGTHTVSSGEVYTLKNLISQDATPNPSTTLKSSRHFSLLSPFRSKTSEKKLATS